MKKIKLTKIGMLCISSLAILISDLSIGNFCQIVIYEPKLPKELRTQNKNE
ncbi:cyclic lactone autoinducer peptide [Carnobacterium divergens]|uniref:cyclic lactone autoinducer peptide n=1 Tax=Carnobacterium divergens TaxID=2748 RepID=UPI001071EF79|nr:cyclic lactone autoinducer peptide [Carnobacterium divergens]MDT1951490.1 cyclic lactone autoinducer peptide [Carnobacterium divergens]MDT1956667.1 cyclic lactone autoinducer peptide [Carnobacterium divergens]MDT1961857.1 cyclic lactone autoinducer peptide [Carnobacterium divergens]MDT1963101.1 cyclic lactone autoinducer peptide [Carnobacterium divergens]TFI76350.1 hypothetical protein CKN81_00115 [Carnobacterium divergens]